MSRLSIKMRVLVALMVPTSAILMLCGFLIMQQNARSQQLTAADQIVGMLPAIVNIAHAMQVERGNSAGLIASDRAGSFRTRVAEARGKTDGLLATLTEKEAQVEKETLDDRNRAAIAQMAQEISKLRAIREGVDTNFSVAQAVAAYTQIVRSIQDRVASIHSLMPAQELAGDIETISAILQLVEYSGLERAVGAVGFATGSFSPEVFARFIGLGERQIPELDLIEKNASAALSKQLADALSTPSAAKVDQRRMAVRENMGQVGTEYVSGQQWFSEATDRIASLIDVESQAIATVQANLKRHHDILSAEIWTQTAILCGLLTAVGVMGFFTVRSIVNPLARLKVSVEKLSNGEQWKSPSQIRITRSALSPGPQARSTI